MYLSLLSGEGPSPIKGRQGRALTERDSCNRWSTSIVFTVRLMHACSSMLPMQLQLHKLVAIMHENRASC